MLNVTCLDEEWKKEQRSYLLQSCHWQQPMVAAGARADALNQQRRGEGLQSQRTLPLVKSPRVDAATRALMPRLRHPGQHRPQQHKTQPQNTPTKKPNHKTPPSPHNNPPNYQTQAAAGS